MNEDILGRIFSILYVKVAYHLCQCPAHHLSSKLKCSLMCILMFRIYTLYFILAEVKCKGAEIFSNDGKKSYFSMIASTKMATYDSEMDVPPDRKLTVNEDCHKNKKIFYI